MTEIWIVLFGSRIFFCHYTLLCLYTPTVGTGLYKMYCSLTIHRRIYSDNICVCVFTDIVLVMLMLEIFIVYCMEVELKSSYV